MSDWISFLPAIIIAQALGVGLAWFSDALSWKWRQNEKIVFALNVIGALALIPLAVPLFFEFWPIVNPIMTFLLISFWLPISAWVQKRQLSITYRAAFFGAMMQWVCFCLALWCGFVSLFFVSLIVSQIGPHWLWSIWLVSTTLTYALLSLFRPTIYGAWNAFRQNFKKNRPMR